MLADDWSFEGLLREHLATVHPDPAAQGRSRAEVLVMAIVSGATKQAASGSGKADLVRLIIDKIDGDAKTRQPIEGDSLTDVRFVIVDGGDEKVIDSSVTSTEDQNSLDIARKASEETTEE
jgi:hypothetical protein